MPASSQEAEVAVVGGRGFIGGALVRRLRADGVPVAVLGRGDLAAGAGLVERARRSRTIYWAASSINPALARSQPERVAADLAGFDEFLDALGRSEARLVLLSSGGTVYGRATPPFTESTPTAPISEYGAAKLALEQRLRERHPNAVVARISNAYGPGQALAPGQGVIGHWLRSVVREEPIEVFGGLDTARDYLYVDDLADALGRLHHRANAAPAVVNLGSGRPTTLKEILDLIHEITGDSMVDVDHREARGFDLERVWLDVGLAEQALGWRPSTDLATGIAAMWDWLRAGEPEL
ncbi:NAD-dependent epimerase/dehydratase family protein [Aeromicrobium duanguangcaii]|uniref:NAD-dependent epimerase/dehydratase family protein n=1 Tax=Aeromicrobium duanguangcaii TaxID=2968086 RepID=UPI0020174714|nr:NAD-dependent epimerase/dehydratase family protein [Aeromicrobium duanguangcaii]MCL3837898.1 NAD-dependent epimerase/dehydratase family protein [Aeromicrobium duanguangcaii]